MADHQRAASRDGDSPLSSTELHWFIKGIVNEENTELKQQLITHVDNKFNELHTLTLSAFPDADPVGHKNYHVAQIAMLEERAELFRELRKKTAVALVWALLVFLGHSVYTHFMSIVASWQSTPK